MKLGRDVAPRIPPDAATADADRLARFHREARSMAAFSPPHVAGVHALEEPGGHALAIAATVDQRTIKIIEDLDLKYWR